MDKRNFTRVDFTATASIKFNGEVIAGNIANLSLKGLHIKTAQEIPLDLPLDVTVYSAHGTSYTLRASAVRRNGTGLGMQILSMGVMTFVFLRDAVFPQFNGQSEVMRETLNVVRYIH